MCACNTAPRCGGGDVGQRLIAVKGSLIVVVFQGHLQKHEHFATISNVTARASMCEQDSVTAIPVFSPWWILEAGGKQEQSAETPYPFSLFSFPPNYPAEGG